MPIYTLESSQSTQSVLKSRLNLFAAYVSVLRPPPLGQLRPLADSGDLSPQEVLQVLLRIANAPSDIVSHEDDFVERCLLHDRKHLIFAENAGRNASTTETLPRSRTMLKVLLSLTGETDVGGLLSSEVHPVEFRVAASVLSRADDGEEASSALEFLLWGPGLEEEDEASERDHLERWLHLERAAALNELLSRPGDGVLAGQARLGADDTARMAFLVDADGTSLKRRLDALCSEARALLS